MMDQINASSQPALVHELLKRHLEGGKVPQMKVKIKLPSHGPAQHPTGKLAANQWQGQ